MKKYYFLIIVVLILGLVLTGCLLSNVGQVPTSEQSGISYLTKDLLVPGNLVGLWHFDEGEGDTAYDSSGTILPNDGTVYGADCWVDGKFGKALSFNGIDDHVDCGDISTANWTSLTTEAWVYWDGTVRQGYAGVYCKEYRKNDIGRLLINGAGVILVQNGNGNFFSDNIGDVPVNEWCHIAYVYDQIAGKEYIYVNGDQKGEQGRIGDITKNSHAFCIGYGWMGPDYYIFSGIIDEVRIWDIALDSTEITHSYELGVNDEMEYVTQLNQQDLLDGGVAIFTSAFYVGRLNLEEEVDVSARAMIVGSDAVVNGCNLRGMTPKGADIGYSFSILTFPDNGFDITAWRKNTKAKSLHLSMLLDTDEGLGVNVQFLPYD